MRPGVDLRIAGADGEPRQCLGRFAVALAALPLFRTGAGTFLARSDDDRVDAVASGAEIQGGCARARLGACLQRGQDRLDGFVALAIGDGVGVVLRRARRRRLDAAVVGVGRIASVVRRQLRGRCQTGKRDRGASILRLGRDRLQRRPCAPFGDVDQEQDEHHDRQRDHHADVVRRKTSPGHAAIVATATPSCRAGAGASRAPRR